MAESQRELMIRIAGRMDASLTNAIHQTQAQLGGLNGMLSRLTGVAGAALGGLAVGAVITDAVNTYKDFDQAMAMTAATAGATGDAYTKMQNAALEAGRCTTKTATESAEALGYLALAGFNVDQSCEALMPILKLSEATMMDLATCSDLVTDSMSAAGVSVEQLPGYLDILCKANNKSNQTAQQLMEAMIKVGGTMKGLNVPIEETSTALGVLANRGLKGAEGGTSLNAIMANLTTGTGEAGKMMDKLGISAFDADGKFIGVQATLMKLNEATKNLTEEERNAAFAAIGGKEQVKALNALMGGLTTVTEDGRTEWEALSAELNNAGGSLDAMNAQVTNTLNGAFSRFGSALDDIKIRAMLAFGPTLTKMVDYISSTLMPQISAAMEKIPEVLEKIMNEAQYVYNVFSENWSLIGPLVIGIGTAFAAIKLGPLIADMLLMKTEWLAMKAIEMEYAVQAAATNAVMFIKDGAFRAATLSAGRHLIATKAMAIGENLYVIATSLATTATAAFGAVLAFVTSPIGLAIIAITALVAAGIYLYNHWDEVKAKAGELWVWLGQKWDEGVQYVSQLWDKLKESAKGVWEKIKAPFASMGAWISEKMNAVGQAISEAWNNSFLMTDIVPKFAGPINNLVQAVSYRFNAIKESITNTWTQVYMAAKIWMTKTKLDILLKVEEIKATWASIVGKFNEIKSQAIQVFNNMVERIKTFFAPLVNVVTNIFNAITSTISGWWNTLVGVLSSWGTTISNIFMAGMEYLKSGIQLVLDIIVGYFTMWGDALMAVFDSIIGSVQDAVGHFTDALVGIIDFLTAVFMGDWEGAWNAIVQTFGSIFAGIESMASAPINAVISLVNSLISSINSISFDIPSWVPGLGGQHFSMNVPSIPALASGGITTGPTTALIGEGSEQEAVLPLSKLSNLISTGSVSGGRSSEPASAPITFAPQITITGNADKDVMAQASQDMFRQFKDFMERYQRENRRFAFSAG